jgi:hypothetical protein
VRNPQNKHSRKLSQMPNLLKRKQPQEELTENNQTHS